MVTPVEGRFLFTFRIFNRERHEYCDNVEQETCPEPHNFVQIFILRPDKLYANPAANQTAANIYYQPQNERDYLNDQHKFTSNRFFIIIVQ